MPGWGGCDVCVTGFEQGKGDFLVSTNLCRSLKLPEGLKAEDVQRVQRDCEILAGILRDNSEEASALLQNIIENKMERAKEISSKLGLTEEEFAKQGGGLMWLVVVVVLLYATDAY